MRIYGIKGICWTTLVTGEIQGSQFILYQLCDRTRADNFKGKLIEMNSDPHDIQEWVKDGKPEGLKGLKTNYSRSPFVVIDGEVLDLVDKTR